MTFDRRRVLSLLGLSAAAPLEAAARTRPAANVAVTFEHGVASGDPLADRVVLWTRVTPAGTASAPLPVIWEVAHDAGFRKMAAHGVTAASGDRDWTVKVDAAGLKPNTGYFYRFRCGKAVSPTGGTRTLPTGPTSDIVLAFVTCSLYPAGYFNAYDHIARLDRVDAVVELGDYYYEYGAGEDDYGMNIGRKLGRIPQPPHDAVTLADYRTRHALYKRDEDLQAAHARAPWICVWDDHETANDSWVGGAENHNPRTEGPWIVRERAALRAYYEWMPIREPEPGRAFEAINRSFRFGDLATLIMVETRLVARSWQLEYSRPQDIPWAVYDSRDPKTRRKVTDPDIIANVLAAVKDVGKAPAPYAVGPDPEKLKAILADPERQMLGARQEEWLKLEVAKSVDSGQPWQIFGNQVVMARTRAPDIRAAIGQAKWDTLVAAAPERLREPAERIGDLYSFDIPYDLDGWDGYPAARERMYDAIKASNANAVIVSGDSHAFWVNQLYDDAGDTRVAAEFGTSSITSPQMGDYFTGVDCGKIFMDENREVLFCDQNRKGYTLVTVTRDQVAGELVAVDVLAKPYSAKTIARFTVQPAPGPGIGEILKA
ncbi:MAG TPA: alkaline phosphatase D family protein [Rhizomicrobium sp.]|nr:alkaline phosphatase D family protein [Rhizomicrobium sp.]